jgi:hypothetical protein
LIEFWNSEQDVRHSPWKEKEEEEEEELAGEEGRSRWGEEDAGRRRSKALP